MDMNFNQMYKFIKKYKNPDPNLNPFLHGTLKPGLNL